MSLNVRTNQVSGATGRLMAIRRGQSPGRWSTRRCTQRCVRLCQANAIRRIPTKKGSQAQRKSSPSP